MLMWQFGKSGPVGFLSQLQKGPMNTVLECVLQSLLVKELAARSLIKECG